ncbi:hypothetical protein BO226_11335 [Rhodococcus sp. 2G]|uniref:DUF7352 domain-containing protein n=1 Tax=Rhodococcus sp. 2G TaxID=1570939 RepID=UPI000903AA02|nr:hypothetical protein [Rhodococcus sp. 2G]APE09726.1 hypothetical protein BO226_11335 [Rhodococcus sp. 2G]
MTDNPAEVYRTRLPEALEAFDRYREGTGHVLVDDAVYVGTAVCPNGFVWHVYLDASTTAVQ